MFSWLPVCVFLLVQAWPVLMALAVRRWGHVQKSVSQHPWWRSTAQTLPHRLILGLMNVWLFYYPSRAETFIPRFWNSNIPFSLTFPPHCLRHTPSLILSQCLASSAMLPSHCWTITQNALFLRPVQVQAQYGLRWVELGNWYSVIPTFLFLFCSEDKNLTIHLCVSPISARGSKRGYLAVRDNKNKAGTLL